MLGKTAGGLFWMARYLERAENIARLLETGQRMALTRSDDEGEWRSVLQAAGLLDGFLATHEEVARETAIDWMLRDADNPASIRCAMRRARDNGRMVRTALTYDVWTALNAAWMGIDAALRRKVSDRDLPRVLEMVRQHAAQVRGSMLGTMLRNDMFNFLRLGVYIERADNTGRILDVKYYVLLPTAFEVGSSLDNVQWEVILRSVGAGGGYRITHGQNTRPTTIAAFLILDPRMPRSLNFCCRTIRQNLDYLQDEYGESQPSGAMAEALMARCANQGVEAIFERGLHEHLQDFLRDLGALGRQIEIDYRFYQ